MARVRLIPNGATPNSIYAKSLDIAYIFTFRCREQEALDAAHM